MSALCGLCCRLKRTVHCDGMKLRPVRCCESGVAVIEFSTWSDRLVLIFFFFFGAYHVELDLEDH